MDRREFLRTTGAAAAASAAGASVAEAALLDDTAPQAASESIATPAIGADVKHLPMALAWPDGVAGPADQARRLAQRISLMSAGRYKLHIVPGDANGLAAVQGGQADLYFGSENDHLGAHRALAYFAGLPGARGIAAGHLTAWMLLGGGQALWDELAGDLGVKAMLAGHSGESCFVARERITDMSELAGRKAAVAGLAREVVRGLGLDPLDAEPASVTTRMMNGEILAAECGGAVATHTLGLSQVAPFAVGASVNRHGYAFSLGIKRSLWEQLPASDQALFSAAATAELQLALAEDESHRRPLRPAPSPGCTWPIAAELGRAIARVADAVVAHVAASDATAARIDASYQAFRRFALGERADTAANV